MIPIIDRYILQETLKSFLAVITVLLLIMVSHGFMRILEQAAEGDISSDVLFTLLGLETVKVLSRIIPPAFFFSILYALGRMCRDSEITALAASGVGLARIYRSLIFLSILIVLLVSWLSLTVQPLVMQAKEEVLQQQKEKADFASAVAGRFNEFSRGDLVFYVEEMSDDKKKLRNIFVQNRQHGTLGLITATKGYQYVDPKTGDQFIVLKDGYRYEGEPGERDFSVGEFVKYGIRVVQKEKGLAKVSSRMRSTPALLESDDIKDKVELEQRLMYPVAVLIFTLVSVPLSRSLPREGIYGRLTLAVLFYFVFLNLQAVSGSWMENGTTPLWLGRWWVHLFMLGLAGILYWIRSQRVRWPGFRIFRGSAS